MKITTFYNIYDKRNSKRTPEEIIKNIRGESLTMIVDESITLEDRVNAVRAIKYDDFIDITIEDEETRLKEALKLFKKVKGKKKTSLPAFTPSMICKDEKDPSTKVPHDLKNFFSHNNIFSVDIDDVSDQKIIELKNSLSLSPDVFFYFVSPSGKGLKIFYIIDIEEDKLTDWDYVNKYHHDAFAHFELYFETKYSVKIDPSCKNVNRLCYLSFDKDSYFNPYPEIVKIPLSSAIVSAAKKVEKVKYIQKVKEITLNGGDPILEEFCEWVSNNLSIFNNIYDIYEEWVKLGLCLINYYNKDLDKGLFYFKKLSSYSKKYDEDKTTEKFNNLVSNFNKEKSPSIRFLFKKMKKFGFKFYNKEDEKQLNNFNNTDIPFMLKMENIIVEQDKYTELFTIQVQGEKKQCNEDVYNSAINIIREKYGNELNRLDIRSYIDDARFYKILDDFKPVLDKNKTSDDTEYKKLFDALKTNNDDVFRLLFTDWFFGVFDNVFTDDYYKFMFVIKGASDVGKTYVINKILSTFKKYVTTDFNWRDSDKDNLQALCQYIFAYDDELSATTKSDIESLKKITSKSTIKVRPAYGRKIVERKRIASFIGSSNPDVFFKDDTGAIRFFAFELLSVDRELFNSINFDKIWGYLWYIYETQREQYVEYRNMYKGDVNEDSRIVGYLEEIINFNYTKTKGYYTRAVDISQYVKEHYKREINFVELSKILKLCGYTKKRKENGVYYNLRLKNLTIDEFRNYELEDLTDYEKKLLLGGDII